jgi:ribosomal protein S27AE
MGYGGFGNYAGYGPDESDTKVCQCPKCGKQTFMLKPKAGFGRHFKGKCYSCGHEQVI